MQAEQETCVSVPDRYVCDLCHRRLGTRFCDGFWSCLRCAYLYYARLQLERIR
jgi:ribosomal protein L37AE/L43A